MPGHGMKLIFSLNAFFRTSKVEIELDPWHSLLCLKLVLLHDDSLVKTVYDKG